MRLFSCGYFWQFWALNFVSNAYSRVINQHKGHSVTSCVAGCVSIEQSLLYNNLARIRSDGFDGGEYPMIASVGEYEYW